MQDLRGTVEKITEDLNELMRQLSGTDDTQARELVEEMLNSQVLADFKVSVDAMRHLLWIYIEAVASSHSQATILQSARLQKAVDMLRALHTGDIPSQFSGPETFFEHVQSVVDEYSTKNASDAA